MRLDLRVVVLDSVLMVAIGLGCSFNAAWADAGNRGDSSTPDADDSLSAISLAHAGSEETHSWWLKTETDATKWPVYRERIKGLVEELAKLDKGAEVSDRQDERSKALQVAARLVVLRAGLSVEGRSFREAVLDYYGRANALLAPQALARLIEGDDKALGEGEKSEFATALSPEGLGDRLLCFHRLRLTKEFSPLLPLSATVESARQVYLLERTNGFEAYSAEAGRYLEYLCKEQGSEKAIQAILRDASALMVIRDLALAKQHPKYSEYYNLGKRLGCDLNGWSAVVAVAAADPRGSKRLTPAEQLELHNAAAGLQHLLAETHASKPAERALYLKVLIVLSSQFSLMSEESVARLTGDFASAVRDSEGGQDAACARFLGEARERIAMSQPQVAVKTCQAATHWFPEARNRRNLLLFVEQTCYAARRLRDSRLTRVDCIEAAKQYLAVEPRGQDAVGVLEDLATAYLESDLPEQAAETWRKASAAGGDPLACMVSELLPLSILSRQGKADAYRRASEILEAIQGLPPGATTAHQDNIAYFRATFDRLKPGRN